MTNPKVAEIKKMLDGLESVADFTEIAPYFNERMREVRDRETRKVRYKFRNGDPVEFTATREGRIVRGVIREVKQVKALVRDGDNNTWDVRLCNLRPQTRKEG